MKIMVAHNAYQHQGGEDIVFRNETALLERAGYDVARFLVNNDHIQGLKGKVEAAAYVLKNPKSLRLMNAALDEEKPDVVHFHNVFPTLSPAAIDMVVKRGIPVVLTLHNYRPLCAAAMFLRDGKVCEKCLSGSKLNGIKYKCYRDSYVGSACVSMIGPYLKKLADAHPKLVTFIALTEFAKSRYVMGGFPSENIIVKGNAMADPGEGEAVRDNKILYVGRLSEEKGVALLMRAMEGLFDVWEIAGGGPDQADLEAMNKGQATFLGALSSDAVVQKMKKARALVMPSQWYEGFPMVALEAMATGTPIIASDIGSLAEIVDHGVTGRLVAPADLPAWQSEISNAIEKPDVYADYGRNARDVFLSGFSEDVQSKILPDIYKQAISSK